MAAKQVFFDIDEIVDAHTISPQLGVKVFNAVVESRGLTIAETTMLKHKIAQRIIPFTKELDARKLKA